MNDQINGLNPVPVQLPAAVLFDMDGLLVETEDLWYQAERVIMTEIGAEWGPEHQGALVGGPLEFAVAYMIEVSGQDHDHEVMLNTFCAPSRCTGGRGLSNSWRRWKSAVFRWPLSRHRGGV